VVSRVPATTYPPGGRALSAGLVWRTDLRLPHDVTLVRYWDPAATKEGDYTAGALVAEKDGIYYVVDMQRVRTRPAGVEQHIRQTAEVADSNPVELYSFFRLVGSAQLAS